jgi:N-acetylglucosaminyl-diphospho-decaprenol L-rhamnosyltransferase
LKVLVVIANYKVAHLTIDCLGALSEEVKLVPDMHVAVCENGTGDDSEQRIRKAIEDNNWQSWCSLMAVSPNLGFTGGNNVIIRPALRSADLPQYVLLLNADTIVRPNALRTLVDFMDEHPSAGIAASRLEDPDGTPQRSAFRFPSPLGEFEANLKLGIVSRLLRRWVVAPPVSNHTMETDWAAGVSMIIRREVLEDVGILDEGYYTHYEDLDLCFNARKAGWPTWYVPESRVVHLVGQSTGLTVKNPKRQPSYAFGARRRYFLKNHGAIYAAMADVGAIAGLALWKLRVALTGKQDPTPPFMLQDSIRHSVFVTGFKLTDVPNPAMTSNSTQVMQANTRG